MNALTTLPIATLAVFALNVLFSVTAVCLLTLLAARLFFRHHPAMRYALCLAGLISALLVPLAVGFMAETGYSLTILSLPASFAPPLAAATPVSPLSAGDTGTLAPVLHPGIVAGIVTATLLWAMGVVLGILHFVRGWKKASRFTDDLRPWEASSPNEAQEAAERLLGHAPPPIFTSPRVASPVAVGLFRPLIILPEGLAETLTSVQLRQILLHEYAHIAFRHTRGVIMERIARSLFWPHPLAHALCRELARAREEVCDNVASQEAGAACYARTLLALAQGMTTAPNRISALALLGPETSLEHRIAGLLDPRRNQMTEVNRRNLWIVAGTAALAIGMTTAIRVVAATAKTKEADIVLFDKTDAPSPRRTTEAKVREAKAAWKVVLDGKSAPPAQAGGDIRLAKVRLDAKQQESLAKVSRAHPFRTRLDQKLDVKQQESLAKVSRARLFLTQLDQKLDGKYQEALRRKQEAEAAAQREKASHHQ